LTNLVDLSLSDNNISDISSLSNLINLKELYVKGNPIPQEQIDDLKESLPNCNVHYDIQNN
jgi:Leucine-rich repeat (LRR) protein